MDIVASCANKQQMHNSPFEPSACLSITSTHKHNQHKEYIHVLSSNMILARLIYMFVKRFIVGGLCVCVCVWNQPMHQMLSSSDQQQAKMQNKNISSPFMRGNLFDQQMNRQRHHLKTKNEQSVNNIEICINLRIWHSTPSFEKYPIYARCDALLSSFIFLILSMFSTSYQYFNWNLFNCGVSLYALNLTIQITFKWNSKVNVEPKTKKEICRWFWRAKMILSLKQYLFRPVRTASKAIKTLEKHVGYYATYFQFRCCSLQIFNVLNNFEWR